MRREIGHYSLEGRCVEVFRAFDAAMNLEDRAVQILVKPELFGGEMNESRLFGGHDALFSLILRESASRASETTSSKSSMKSSSKSRQMK